MSTEPEQPTTTSRFRHQKTVLLRTRKRDGSWVPTPVSIAVEGERAFFRTYDTAGKVKRIRNFVDVELAPSTARGRPTGPSVSASARLLAGAEAEQAARALAGKYPLLQGLLVPLAHRATRHRTLHYELTDLRG